MIHLESLDLFKEFLRKFCFDKINFNLDINRDCQ